MARVAPPAPAPAVRKNPPAVSARPPTQAPAAPEASPRRGPGRPPSAETLARRAAEADAANKPPAPPAGARPPAPPVNGTPRPPPVQQGSPAAPAMAGDVASKLAALEATIARQGELIAKFQARARAERTAEALLDPKAGQALIPPSDWRHAYQGVEAFLRPYTYDAKADRAVADPKGKIPVPVLFHVPSDNDCPPRGRNAADAPTMAQERELGRIATSYGKLSSGAYTVTEYLSQEETEALYLGDDYDRALALMASAPQASPQAPAQPTYRAGQKILVDYGAAWGETYAGTTEKGSYSAPIDDTTCRVQIAGALYDVPIAAISPA